MSVRFILGRAGSGKTHLCLTEILEEVRRAPDGPALILLVPDQATYQMERALLGAEGVDGFVRVCPYSFARLSHRIFGEIGGAPLPVLDDLGKQMFLASVMRDVRSDLCVYGTSSRRVGFVESVARCIAEFHWYGKGPEDVRLEAERRRNEAGGDTPLSLKLLDLARIYKGFQRKIEGRFVDGDGALAVLAERLPESAWIKGARVWVDGFSGFTPQEYGVLAALIRTVDTFSISLCLDPRCLPESLEDLDALSAFHPSEETYLRLRDALPPEVERLPTVTLPAGGADRPRFASRPDLAALEAGFFARGVRAYEGRPSGVRLVEAPDRRAEVREVARDILRRAREDGTRYRRMAVIVRDLEPYADLVRSIFSEHGIPFFLDERRSVAHHPLVELVRCAVRVVATGWPTDVVLQYLKTDLVPGLSASPEPRGTPERLPVDDVENYALAFGVRGAQWRTEEPWAKRALRPEDAGDPSPDERAALERVDAARRNALRELVAFDAKVRDGRPAVCEVMEALYTLLNALGVRQRLIAWAAEVRERGDPATAEEHATVWKNVVGLLEGLESALGDEVLPLREILDILEAGLSSLRLGLIPPTVDQVTVGSVERSRHPELQVAYVLGVGDGSFPRARHEDPILSDQDRDRLHGTGFELAPSAGRELHRERYFAYIAFTRARDGLWVSYPRADEEGAELLPSAFVRRFEQLFPDLPVERLERDTGPRRPEDVVRVEDLAEAVNRGARTAPHDPSRVWWLRGLDRLLDTRGVREALGKTLPALTYRNFPTLQRLTAAALYGNTLRCGVVGLEGFARCPFQYFARYGLGLEERPEFELGPPDLGSLYHEVLRRFFERTCTEGLRWADLDSGAARTIVREELEKAVPTLKADVLRASERNKALLEDAGRALEEYVEILLVHAQRTDFEPVAAEVNFRDAPDLDLGERRRLKIRGRIDRVDAVPASRPPLVRVVDYKSSKRTLELWRVEAGLDLQLTTYLLALRDRPGLVGRPEAVIPAGAFFARLRAPIRTVKETPEENTDEPPGLGEFRLRGVYRADVARVLDRTVVPSGKSATHSMYVNKDGSLGRIGTTDALPGAGLDRLVDRTVERLRAVGRGIVDGRVAVEPYRVGTESACPFCPYMSVCRFEPPENGYRVLEPVKRAAMVRMLGEDADA